MTDAASSPVLPTDIALEVALPVVSRPGFRSPGTLNAVGIYLAQQPRYIHRDVDGKPGDETFCNFLVREGLRMLGIDMPRKRANDFPDYFRSTDALADSWSWEPLWVARELGERGCPVVAVQPNPTGPGHVALVQASRSDAEYQQALRLNSMWICQAGVSNFAHGLLRQGFHPDRQITFFAHP